MADQHHKIGTQYLDLEFYGSETDAMALQGRLSDVYMRHIAPAVERVLDRFSNRDELLMIDRLEIDAGTVGLDRLEQMLPEMVAGALEKVLRKIPESTESSPDPQGDITFRRLTEEKSAMEALLCFLKKGTLPWSYRPASPSEFETLLLKVLEKPATQEERPGVDAAMLRVLALPVARKRLVAQFSRRFVDSVLGRLMPGTGELLNSIVERFRLSGTLPDVLTKIEDTLREHAFACAASGRSVTKEVFLKEIERLGIRLPVPGMKKRPLTDHSDTDEVAHTENDGSEPDKSEKPQKALPAFEQADECGSRPQRSADDPEQVIDRSKNDAGVPSQDKHEYRTRPIDSASEESSSSENLIRPLHVRGAEKPDATGTSSDSGTATQKNAGFAMPEEHPDEISVLYVDHAGLVLLHPFLPQFFRALGIAGDDKLLMPDRALQLLHFLATGKEQAAEYELVFPKILCGLPTGALVGKPEGLKPEEREEASALLSAVTGHWDALKNTGQDALRETYLKRPGKLSRRNDGDWLLQVESKSYDILLDRLPWGISMVQLPWMARMIRVEWSY